mmetsp:Transcript_20687/g.18334  ORF Transcript_20687/g.18334 Transcript_20687/m.18334 type:complete len:112 (+) Transcript_20687:276-611(+)
MRTQMISKQVKKQNAILNNTLDPNSRQRSRRGIMKDSIENRIIQGIQGSSQDANNFGIRVSKHRRQQTQAKYPKVNSYFSKSQTRVGNYSSNNQQSSPKINSKNISTFYRN